MVKEQCSVGCSGHVSHPCEKCGTQWTNEESISLAKGKKPCEDCGTFKDVYFCIDPYNEDIEGKPFWMFLCGKCRNTRVSDI